mgnify:FL=1
MIKLLIDFLQFLYTVAPLLLSVAAFTFLSILLSKSIKKHATVYYIVFAIPFFLVAIPFVGRLFGAELFNLVRVPILGQILRDYIHMGTFGFPLLVIIMYMGALDPKVRWVKRLLNIRKELSIISGFPVLTHSLIRVTNNFPSGLKFFIDKDGYLSNTPVASELGAGITSFSFIVGVLLLVLFIPLWVTSFDSVHRRMGRVTWKKVQRWAYVLYALLFIHAMGLQIGWTLNPRGGHAAPKVVAECTVKQPQKPVAGDSAIVVLPASGHGHGHAAAVETPVFGAQKSGQGIRTVERAERNVQAESPKGGRRAQNKGLADIQVGAHVKRSIHIGSLILIFGSYLYLRVRKAKKDAKKKSRSLQ